MLIIRKEEGYEDFWSGKQDNGRPWTETGRARLEAGMGKMVSLMVDF